MQGFAGFGRLGAGRAGAGEVGVRGPKRDPCRHEPRGIDSIRHTPSTGENHVAGREIQWRFDQAGAAPRRICGENEAAGLRLRAAVGGAVVVW